MEMLGTDGLCSLAQLKNQFSGNDAGGLKRILEEVQRWIEDPRETLRAFSVEYLRRIIIEGIKWE